MESRLQEREGELVLAADRVTGLEAQLALSAQPPREEPLQQPPSTTSQGELQDAGTDSAAAVQVLEARVAALQALAEMQERELLKLGVWGATGTSDMPTPVAVDLRHP